MAEAESFGFGADPTKSLWQSYRAPALSGRSLGLFGANSAARESIHSFCFNRWTEGLLMLLIIANTVAMIVGSWDAAMVNAVTAKSTTLGWWLGYADYAVTAAFLLETVRASASASADSRRTSAADPTRPRLCPPRPQVLKVIALGLLLDRHSYLRDAWHRLDLFVVLVSVLAIVGELGFTPDGTEINGMKALRSMRGLRPLRAVKFLPGLRMIVNALRNSFSRGKMRDVVLLLLFFFVVYGCLGMEFFSGALRRRCVKRPLANLTEAQLWSLDLPESRLVRERRRACNGSSQSVCGRTANCWYFHSSNASANQTRAALSVPPAGLNATECDVETDGKAALDVLMSFCNASFASLYGQGKRTSRHDFCKCYDRALPSVSSAVRAAVYATNCSISDSAAVRDVVRACPGQPHEPGTCGVAPAFVKVSQLRPPERACPPPPAPASVPSQPPLPQPRRRYSDRAAARCSSLA